ncbi:MAG: tetratricopeptide repeat-containing sensor histidine kinase, partial [Bacteroidales bacterium]|nr:tetratricopeptide repeat-containing sensor histidine kinase [Bacteroidales bacterium]
ASFYQTDSTNFTISSTERLKDSLLHLYNTEQNSKQKALYLLEICRIEENTLEAVSYAEKAIHLTDSLALKEENARANHLSGIAWKKWGDYNISAERLNYALDYYEKRSMQREVSLIKNDLGETLRASNNYNLAFSNFNSALEYFIKLNDSLEIAKTYNRLAATQYEFLAKNPEFETFNTSIYVNKLPYKDAILMVPNFKKSEDTLLYYISQSKHYAACANSKSIIISTDIIYASHLRATGQTDEAILLFDKIIADIYQFRYYVDLPLVLYNKSLVYINNINDIPKAIELSLEALQLSKKFNIRLYEYLINTVLQRCYSTIGDYKNAFVFIQNNEELSKHFVFEELRLKLLLEELDYQYVKRESELKNRNLRMVMLLVFFAFFLLFSFIATINVARKNRKLKSLLEELNTKNDIISKQKDELKDAVASKDKFFSIIAHDLKGPFSAVKGLTEMLVDNINDKNMKGVEECAFIILKSSQKSMELITNLLTWARSQIGHMEFIPRILNLNSTLEESLQILKESAGNKNIELINIIQQDTLVFADKEMLNIIFRNLVSNSIKFTNAGGEIVIWDSILDNKVVIFVKDTGIGIPEVMLKEIFSLNATTGRQGTNNEYSTGLGLILCKEFVEKNGGEIFAESTEGEGSTFRFTLPYNLN